MIVVDTGPIVAAVIADDKNHQRCTEEFTRLRRAHRPLLVPSFVAGEACYMLGKIVGAKAEASLIRLFESGWFQLVDLTEADLARIAVLVERYDDLPLGISRCVSCRSGGANASRRVMTLDHRDFSVVRPVHVPAFTLLPV
jgi:predicted nucleic acid-binding protein